MLFIKKLFDFYNSWKEEWSKQLTIPDANRDDTEMQANGSPDAMNPAPATPGGDGGGAMPAGAAAGAGAAGAAGGGV